MGFEIDYDTKTSLVQSLPRRLYEVVSNMIILHPRTKEIIHLKQRPTYEDMPITEYIYYNEAHDVNYPYDELFGQFVIIDSSLLNLRGRTLLSSL